LNQNTVSGGGAELAAAATQFLHTNIPKKT